MPQAAVRDKCVEKRDAAVSEKLNKWKNLWQGAKIESGPYEESDLPSDQDSWMQPELELEFKQQTQQNGGKDAAINELQTLVQERLQRASGGVDPDALKEILDTISGQRSFGQPTKQQTVPCKAGKGKGKPFATKTHLEVQRRRHRLLKTGRCAWQPTSLTTLAVDMRDARQFSLANPHIYLTTPANEHYILKPKPSHQILTDAQINLIRRERDGRQEQMRERLNRRRSNYYSAFPAELHSAASEVANRAREWWTGQQDNFTWAWLQQKQQQVDEACIHATSTESLERAMEGLVLA